LFIKFVVSLLFQSGDSNLKTLFFDLKLSAVDDDNLLSGGSALATNFLDVSNDVHTFADLAENDVFTVQPRSNSGGQEKLTAVGVWSAVGHGQETWSGVLSDEVFVGKFFAIDGFSSGTVLSGEVATLAHETWNDSVEWRAFVAHTFFSGAESSEVLNGFWYFIVHVEHDSTGGLATNGHIKKALDRHGKRLVRICKFDLRL